MHQFRGAESGTPVTGFARALAALPLPGAAGGTARAQSSVTVSGALDSGLPRVSIGINHWL